MPNFLVLIITQTFSKVVKGTQFSYYISSLGLKIHHKEC